MESSFIYPLQQTYLLLNGEKMRCITYIYLQNDVRIPYNIQMKMRNLFLLNSVLLILCLRTVSSENCDDFEQFKTRCKRIYAAGEQANRKIAFEANCKKINQFNEPSVETYSKELNCFNGDRLQTESPFNLGLVPLKTSTLIKETTIPETTPGKVAATVLPASYNMVTLGYVTSIKNQGSCGCCWSFAATGLYESDLLLRGYSYGLSEQGALQCTNNYSPGNRISDCSGGYFEDPLYYYAVVGGVLRSNYGYTAGNYGSGAGFPITNGICNEVNRIYIGKGAVKVYGGLSRTQIKTLLVNKGPLMIGVYANQAFLDYSSGVFTGCPVDAGNYINHAILLVGYDDSSSSWLVKNQWGSGWGESGYMRLSYSRDCGMSSLLANLQFTELSANPEVSFDGNKALIGQTYLGESYAKYFIMMGLLIFASYLF